MPILGGLSGIKIGVMLAICAGVGVLIWDYRDTKAELAETIRDRDAAIAEKEMMEIARDEAIRFGEAQRARSLSVERKKIEIRRRPDGKTPASGIILDAIDGLRSGSGSAGSGEN